MALCLAWLPAASAQQQQPEDLPDVEAPVIIVVDFQAVLRDSLAVASIDSQMEHLRLSLQQQFSDIEQDLRAFEQQLSEDRARLSEEDFLARRREFEQRVTDAQRAAQARRSELDRINDEAVSQVRVALLQVIAGIARDVGATIVLNKNQVILTDRSFDFTEESLAQLNDLLPSVDIDTRPFSATTGDREGGGR